MTRFLDSLAEIASDFDAIVLDQWGVLHDGSAPYPRAADILAALRQTGIRLAVLSNSGKRSAPNARRIADMGFPADLFDCVMTSGEALWQDMSHGRIPETRFFAIERTPGDAARWAEGLDLSFPGRPDEAEALLLMGLPDGDDGTAWRAVLDHALAAQMPVYCSNPDRASPRAGGKTVLSPGALAHDHADRGGHVVFYGKPHKPVFDALELALDSDRLLMVGDSLEHDIAGGRAAGWSTALIRNGLYARTFAKGSAGAILNRLTADMSAPAPDYTLEWLQ